MGIDVLQALQFSAKMMDPRALERRFGDRLCSKGGSVQTMLPFGTVDEVRATVRELIDTVGKGGGFVIAPTHLVEPEVPWENIVTFVETVDQYGVYA